MAGCVVIHHERLFWRRAAILPGGVAADASNAKLAALRRVAFLQAAYKLQPY